MNFSPQDPGLAAILDSASPAIYRRNALRVLGKEGSETGDLLPLDESPSEAEKGRARDKLADPVTRFVEEFFWFWPDSDQASEVFPFLREHRLDEARRILEEPESHGARLAILHSLALLDHFAALELEERAKIAVLSRQALAECDRLWQRALAWWRQVFGHAPFEAHLASSAAARDPRLGANPLSALRDLLEGMVLRINAQLALHAARVGDRGEAERQLRFLHGSGLRTELVADLFGEQVAPLADRLRQACLAAERSVRSQPAGGLVAAEQLLGAGIPWLQEISLWLGAAAEMHVKLRDELAGVAFQGVISYAEATEDWPGAQRVLEQIAELSPGKELRRHFAERQRAAGHAKRELVCHFCGGMCDDASALSVALHSSITRTPIKGTTSRKTWKRKVVRVPRCASCRWHHDHPQKDKTPEESRRPGKLGCMATLPVLAIGSAIMWLMPADTAGRVYLSMWVLGVAGAVMLGVMLYLELGEIMIRTSSADLTKADEYPIVAELLASGWAFGSRPEAPDKFAAVDVPEETEFSELTGCPQCGQADWWNDPVCSLCDGERQDQPLAAIDWNETHQALRLLMRLPGAPAASAVEALNRGERDQAAAVLLQAGLSADDTRRMIAGWEQPRAAIQAIAPQG